MGSSVSVPKKKKDMEASKKKNAMRKKNIKQEEKNEAATTQRYVPYELISDIFVHLPYKSLTRLKTACKQWYSITDDNQFVDKYMHRTANYPSNFIVWTDTYTNPFGVPLDHGLSYPRLSFHVYSLCCDGYTYSKQTKPMLLPHRVMLPSSYGLVGLFCPTFRYTSVFNPTSEEIITLPNFPEEYMCIQQARYNVLGFGFEPQSMKYKFVQLVCNPGVGISRCHVLTVRRGAESCWRAIDVTLSCHLSLHTVLPICADGVLYWETNNYDPEGYIQILKLDLCRERIDMISSPYKQLGGGLVVLEGKLCYWWTELDSFQWMQMDISVLQGRLGWSLLYRLELGPFLPSLSEFFPVCIRDGKVLLCANEGALYSYKIKEKKLKNYKIIGKDDGNLSKWLHRIVMVVHSETLVVLD